MIQRQTAVPSCTSARWQLITRLWTTMMVLCAMVWILALLTIEHTIRQGKGFPLGERFPAFEDIMIYRYRFAVYHSAAFFRPLLLSRRFLYPPAAFAYPPAAALIYEAFYTVSRPDILFTTISALWTALIFAGAVRLLHRHLPGWQMTTLYAAGLALFSFPVIFLADRSNIELFVWMTITAAVLLYRGNHPLLAAVLIGLAASIKLYPILLLGLFLHRRRDFRAVAVGLFVAVAITFFAIWYAGPNLSLAANGFLTGVLRFTDQHAVAARAAEAVFDHSFFSPVKIRFLHEHGTPQPLTRPYYLIAGGSMLTLFLARVRRFPLLNRLTFLSAAMISLPPVSYEYTIVHLYLPLFLLLLAILTAGDLQASVAGRSSSLSQFVALCLLLFLTFPLGLLENGHFLLAGQIKAGALALLTLCTAWTPWHVPELHEREPAPSLGRAHQLGHSFSHLVP